MRLDIICVLSSFGIAKGSRNQVCTFAPILVCLAYVSVGFYTTFGNPNRRSWGNR